MKKSNSYHYRITFISIFSIISLFSSVKSSSQSTEYSVGLQIFSIRGTAIEKDPLDNSDDAYSAEEASGDYLQALGGIGWYFPVKSFSNEFTTGLSINLLGSVSFAGGANGYAPDGILGMTTPAYVHFKYGAGSSKNSESDFGFGLGVGATFQGIIGDFINNNPNDEGVYGYVAPILSFEISCDKGKSSSFIDNLKLTIQTQLGKYEQQNNLMDHGINNNIDYGYTFAQTSVSIARFLDFK